jgi:hypothetical protein
MSVETTTLDPSLARAEARLLRWMVACSVIAVLAALLCGQGRFAAGLTLGSALGILNFFWLHQAVEAVMTTRRPRVSWGLVATFVVRYPLAFAAVLVFYWTGWLPFGAILAGLFVPTAGVLIEGIVQLRESFRTT